MAPKATASARPAHGGCWPLNYGSGLLIGAPAFAGAGERMYFLIPPGPSVAMLQYPPTHHGRG
jgi:hypothetical protein